MTAQLAQNPIVTMPLQQIKTNRQQMEDSCYYYDFQPVQTGLYTTPATPTRLKESSLFEREREETASGDLQWREGKKTSTYYWSDLQNKRYIKFLKEQGYLLLLPPNERKAKKVNLLMSKKVKTRNSTQCHTHHQKMIGKHQTIEQIVSYYEALFQAKRKNSGEVSMGNVEQRSAGETRDSENPSQEAKYPAIEREPISEPAAIWTECILGGELFEHYFQFEEDVLMEWIDW